MNPRAYETMTDPTVMGGREDHRQARCASSLRLLCASALLAFVPLVAVAQTTPERLPDLTPRAFEIRGDLQISLPNLERQPLRGFAPPPRTYVVPGSRQTYIAPYGQRLDGLPADPLAQPDPPEVATLAPLTGRIDAGFGRTLGRLGRFTLNAGGLGVDFNYTGFSGFEPFADDDRDASSDVFDGHVAFTSPGPTRLGFALDGDYQRYTLIGADGLATADAPLPDRTGRTIGGSASVASEAADRASYAAEARFASTEVGLSEGDDEAFDQTEVRFEADGHAAFSRLRLDAAGALAGLGDEGLGESLTTYSAGGALRLDLSRGRLDVGARVLGYDASTLNGGGSSVNVGPVVDLDVPVSTTTRLFARSEPHAERRGLAGLFRENPYAMPEPVVAPDLHVADARAGIEVQSRAVRVTAFGLARYSPVFLYFERIGIGRGTTAGLYEARYDEAVVFGGGGALTVYAPNGFRATAEAEARVGSLRDGDRDIPYFAPVVGRLSLAMPFAEGRGLVQLTGTAESARPTETEGDDAPAWARLDAEAHYLLAAGFGVLLRAERLAGRAEQWPGFPRPPATVLVGLRARW